MTVTFFGVSYLDRILLFVQLIHLTTSSHFAISRGRPFSSLLSHLSGLFIGNNFVMFILLYIVTRCCRRGRDHSNLYTFDEIFQSIIFFSLKCPMKNGFVFDNELPLLCDRVIPGQSHIFFYSNSNDQIDRQHLTGC